MSFKQWKALCKKQISKYYIKEIFTFEPNKLRNFINLEGLAPKYAS